MELNDQSLKIVEEFCYFGDTVVAGEDAFDGVLTGTSSGWCKFKDLVPLLACGCLLLVTHSVLLYGS